MSTDPVPVRQRPLPAVSVLSQWKQLHGDPAHLRLLPAAGCGRGLRHADARHGGTTEEGGLHPNTPTTGFC